MPSRNVLKIDVQESYYHIYARGASRQDIFLEPADYCLMSNHFHLLVYQISEGAMQRLMRGVMTAYSRYFNKKYKRSGSLFESRYKASMIMSDEYLMHITRYIHLNPKQWRKYPYSSLSGYLSLHTEDWWHEGRILELFPSRAAYGEFVADYEAIRDSLALIKHELAGGED